MRTRKPRINLIGFDTGHSTVLRSDRPNYWVVLCKQCGGEHEQSGREIQRGSKSRSCPKFKPHNHSGLDRWDAIIRRMYGISLAEYEQMLEKQGGGCAICGATTDVGGRKLSIDHCHQTSLVRGILCAHCNQGLGHFKDSPHLLEKASKYLSQYANAR